MPIQVIIKRMAKTVVEIEEEKVEIKEAA